MNRIGLKIICLVVSVVIWIQVASHSTVEQNATLPLIVTGLDVDTLTLEGSVLPKDVSVRLSGSKLSLVLHNIFNRYVGEVRVSLWDLGPGPEFSYEVAASDVYSDLKVVSVQSPLRLRLQIDRREFKLLPVRQRTIGKLRPGLAFLEPPQLKPDSVLVSGPGRFFVEGLSVEAQPLDLSKLKESARLTVRLTPPGKFLHLATSQIALDCLVAEIEDRTLANIPVIPLVDTGRPPVGLSPPVVDVMVRGVADSVRALTANRFLVTVPVGNLEEGIYYLPGQVDNPDWLEVIGLDPPEFQVIVGSPSVSLDSLYDARGTLMQDLEAEDD
jgi:YbbR domain-containing protein